MFSQLRLHSTKWAPRLAGMLAFAAFCSPAMGQFGGFGKKIMEKAQKVQEASKPISVDQEKDIGREVSAKMVAAFHVYANDALTRYVNEVGQTVAAQSERKDIQYHFSVLDSDDINAYSAPGGYVFITKGALALCEDESELAGVLGHEVGHIAAKHVIHEIEAANRKGAVAGELGEQAGNLTKNAPGSSAYKEALQNVVKNIIMNTIFGKGLPAQDEFDADQRGVRYAHEAGYPADGLERFLKAFQTATGQGGKQSYMTTTHPPVEERDSHIEQEIAQQNWQDADRPKLADRYATLTAMLKPQAGS